MRFRKASKHPCHGRGRQRASAAAWPGHGGTIGRADGGTRGLLALSKQAQSSPPISCPPSRPGGIFKGVSVSSGMCWRWMGSATRTAANRAQKAQGLPGDGQGGESALPMCRHCLCAGTACVLAQGAQVPPRPALITPGPAQGLMYPQGLCEGLCSHRADSGQGPWGTWQGMSLHDRTFYLQSVERVFSGSGSAASAQNQQALFFMGSMQG